MHSGWTNYETNAVNNWFGEMISERGAEVELLPTQIRSLVEETLMFSFENSFLSDILTNSLSKVNWTELAEAYAPEEEFLYDEA